MYDERERAYDERERAYDERERMYDERAEGREDDEEDAADGKTSGVTRFGRRGPSSAVMAHGRPLSWTLSGV